MTDWVWNLLLFSWGFVAGLGVTIAAVAVARMHREARYQGEQLVSRLGTVDTRRFLEAATE